MNDMDTAIVTRKFGQMGARIKFGELRRPRFLDPAQAITGPPLTLDVKKDKAGQYFEVLLNPRLEGTLKVAVLDLQVPNRHLLLMAKHPGAKAGQVTVSKFLCGHDERFWFAAAVPEHRGASTVKTAMEALKPVIVRDSQGRHAVKGKDLNARKNAGYVRQGEWFFIPAPTLVVADWLVLQNEPMVRGRGKPHVAQFLYREGGTTVYASRNYSNSLTEDQYQELIKRDPSAKNLRWQIMTLNPDAYVKGWVRHPDHKTVVLPCWHRVVPNTESEAAAGPNLAFLD